MIISQVAVSIESLGCTPDFEHTLIQLSLIVSYCQVLPSSECSSIILFQYCVTLDVKFAYLIINAVFKTRQFKTKTEQ